MNHLLENEAHIFVGQLVVNNSVSAQLGLNVDLIFVIQVNLENLATINLAPGPLALDLSWVNNILQNSILDGGECPATWPQSLGFLITRVGFSEDAPLCNHDNVRPGELLLELAYEAVLDGLEGFVELEWNVDDNCLASRTTLDFLGGGDVKITEGGFELCVGGLEAEELFCYSELKLIWLCLFGGQNTDDFERRGRERKKKIFHVI